MWMGALPCASRVVLPLPEATPPVRETQAQGTSKVTVVGRSSRSFVRPFVSGLFPHVVRNVPAAPFTSLLLTFDACSLRVAAQHGSNLLSQTVAVSCATQTRPYIHPQTHPCIIDVPEQLYPAADLPRMRQVSLLHRSQP